MQDIHVRPLFFEDTVMKKLVLVGLFAIGTSVAHAAPAQKTTCYTFTNNKLQQKSACTVQNSDSETAMQTILKVGKKSYRFETEMTSGNYATTYYADGDAPQSVESYKRSPRTLKLLPNTQIADTKPLYCHKTSDGKVDVCFD